MDPLARLRLRKVRARPGDHLRHRSPAIRILRLVGRLLPGDYLRTAVYRAVVLRPRKALRLALLGFYRMDHVYDVLDEFRRGFTGRFAVLEFGTAAGYAFVKLLYATRYLGMEDRVTVHGFDTFEGLAAPDEAADGDLVAGDDYVEGQYRASYEALEAHCRRLGHTNFRLHRGDFAVTLNDELLESLRTDLPILVWIDCNYYESARVVMARLAPYLPAGCVVYFDDYDWNFGSRFTGEAKLVHEINAGRFGEGIELVLDPRLSMDSRRVYRFVTCDARSRYTRAELRQRTASARLPTDGSPLP
jgi:hypothetical protein